MVVRASDSAKWAGKKATEELALAWPGFVGAAAVDRRNLRTHRAQIHGELAAMVNAVVVDEAEVEHHPGS